MRSVAAALRTVLFALRNTAFATLNPAETTLVPRPSSPTPLLTFLILHLSFFITNAQTLEVKAPSQVGVGQRFQISWTINGNGSDLKLPDIKGFSVLGGPNQSMSYSMINGQMSQSVGYSYVLQASKEGEYTIGPASAKVDGKQVSSKAVTIKVVPGQPQQQAQGGSQGGQQQRSSGSGNDMFARVEVSRRSVDRGEELYAECKVYSRSALVQLVNYKLPEYTGFWTKDIEMPEQVVVDQEVVDGVAYQVVSLKKTLLYPQKAGKLEIDPMQVEVVVRESTGRPRSIFDMFGGYQDVRRSATSPKVVIDVRDLPAAGQPAGFSGLTGKFNMTVKADKNKVKAGDAVTLKLTISGSGNLYQLQNPEFTIPPDVEVYDPKVADNISVKASGISGSRSFEYVMIPRYEGNFEVGPFAFSYYDPSSDRYVTVSEPAIALTVEKGDGTTQAVSPTMNIADKSDIQIIGTDIRYIKQGQYSLRQKGDHFFMSALWWLLMLLPVAGGAGAMAYHIHQERQAGDVAGSRSRKAKKMAVKRMDGAKRLMTKNDQKGFNEEVMKALTEYVSHRFNIPVAELSRERMREVFALRSVPQEVADTLIKVLDEAEFARFAPGASGPMESLYESSLNAIIKMEDHV
jgi:hypothetical protein